MTASADTERRPKIAFVPPRFGRDLGGGAEALTSDLASILSLAGAEVEVWTTCARDHRSWDNFHPPGQTVEAGLKIRRFPVDPRDLEKFIGAEIKMAEGRELSIEEQTAWLENSVNSSALYQHIAAAGPQFDWIIFAPYLFATTFWGSLIYPERSAVIPCLHDEAYAYLPVFSHLFSKVGRVIFNAEPEMELAARLYPAASITAKGRVVGMSFEPGSIEPNGTQLPDGLTPGSYLLYSGRKERGKNLDLAIEYFAELGDFAGPLKLVLIGSGAIDFMPKLPPGVLDLGFVDEQTKTTLMHNSLALLQPSTNESFSIVLMESWLTGRPAIVNGHCAVTRFHAEQSGGGLYFCDFADFSGIVKTLVRRPGLADELGAAGRSYVLNRYCAAGVRERLLAALDLCIPALHSGNRPDHSADGQQR